jgi:outer membrane immunogenic protein
MPLTVTKESGEREVKKVLSAAALLTLGFVLPAAAADLPARYAKAPAMMPVIYDWSGFYIGFNGGGASSRKCWDFTTPAGAFLAAEGCHDATGAVAGGQVGYRWQASNFVFGLEAQGDWANIRGSNVSLIAAPFTNVSRIDAMGLFTGQVGWAWNSVLLYAKGGAAVVADRFHVETTAGNVLAATASNDTRWGATVGAGVEFGFAPNWSVAAEYNHLFMQDRLVSFSNVPGGGLFGTDRIRQDVDMATVRVNYRFGGPLIAKY